MIDRSDGLSLRSGFLRFGLETPEAPAVMVRGRTHSYSEMEDAARRWSYEITRAFGGRAERVGIFAYRSEVAYVGTLAALFSGAAFVPMNPTFPVDKTASMIKEADLDAIIVDSTCWPKLTEVLSAADPLVLAPELDTPPPQFPHQILTKSDLVKAPPLLELPALASEDTAYLLFTSGSTGKPKGVPVTHSNAMHFLSTMADRYGITNQDRFSQTFEQTFDLSIFDLFMAWNNGACVVAMSPVDLLSPIKYINEHSISVWFSVPSVAAHMSRRGTLQPGTMASLRYSLFCGEPLLRGHAEAWQQAAPNSQLENLYGPTELTIACLVHRWDPASSPALCRDGIVPIGRPLRGLTATVIGGSTSATDLSGGELCLAGPQTTPGYWRAPDLTSERYIMLPITRREERRFYRTGDRVARLPSGEYSFVGRTDQQLKVMGHRVELGEIEAALRGDATVEHAVAFGYPLSNLTADSIIAFVTGLRPDAASLLERARAALPPYMVPRVIHVLDEMPLNANGKIDRGQLRARLAAEGTGEQGPLAKTKKDDAF